VPAEQLRTALVALESDDCRAGLTSLLEAWRVVRHPRIADLIDHVSGELVAGAPKITGKTIAARSEAWHAIEQQGDLLDVGRLVAMPWPGSWQNALPILQALVARPDDPRIALALARAALETRYESRAAERFITCCSRLTELRDLRCCGCSSAAPRTSTTRPGGSRRSSPMAAGAVADLEDARGTRDSVSPSDRDGAGPGDRRAGVPAAIAADPDNPGVRAVYGDWLVERGDPRGELLALQLARAGARARPPHASAR
jgi:uncharacterized protein (TIGR02996 family)